MRGKLNDLSATERHRAIRIAGMKTSHRARYLAVVRAGKARESDSQRPLNTAAADVGSEIDVRLRIVSK